MSWGKNGAVSVQRLQLHSWSEHLKTWRRRFPDDGLENSGGSALFFWLLDRKGTSGFRCLPFGALGPAAGPLPLPGAADRSGRGGAARLARGVRLAVCSLQVVVLQTAQLAVGGPGPQPPLPVSLAEGVGAELAEGLGVLPADVTVVPGAVPAACGTPTRLTSPNPPH